MIYVINLSREINCRQCIWQSHNVEGEERVNERYFLIHLLSVCDFSAKSLEIHVITYNSDRRSECRQWLRDLIPVVTVRVAVDRTHFSLHGREQERRYKGKGEAALATFSRNPTKTDEENEGNIPSSFISWGWRQDKTAGVNNTSGNDSREKRRETNKTAVEGSSRKNSSVNRRDWSVNGKCNEGHPEEFVRSVVERFFDKIL